MSRLTQKDEQGNWCLKGLPWEQLHVGQAITQEAWEKLYGALWKLMEYEDTVLSPQCVERLNDFEKTQTAHCLAALQEEQRKHQWIPVAEQLPEIGEPVLVTLWDRDVTIGTWYGHRWGTALYYSEDVLAWMPKPENYRPAD